jgi:hypothetical protein
MYHMQFRGHIPKNQSLVQCRLMTLVLKYDKLFKHLGRPRDIFSSCLNFYSIHH